MHFGGFKEDLGHVGCEFQCAHANSAVAIVGCADFLLDAHGKLELPDVRRAGEVKKDASKVMPAGVGGTKLGGRAQEQFVEVRWTLVHVPQKSIPQAEHVLDSRCHSDLAWPGWGDALQY